jgi:hypothetical protein
MAAVKERTRNYTEAEWDTLDEKMDFPSETVLCPRCGSEVIYEKIGNSISVKCLTEDCIFGGIRGL